MIEHTFRHIHGIGEKKEERIWRSRLYNWDLALEYIKLHYSLDIINRFENIFNKSKSNIDNNPKYFSKRLDSNQHWRLFRNFKDCAAYLDIETTGLYPMWAKITTISLYDGKNIYCYINGKNLTDFIKDISKYKLLITYNGKCFDIPFINHHLNCNLDQAHIDLRFVLHSLGFKGGLKGCEKQLGVNRKDLNDIDGLFAIDLWYEYKNTGNENALSTLLAYNIEDVINLEYLMHVAYNLKILRLPFYKEIKMSIPKKPNNPYEADVMLIKRLKKRLYGI